MGLFQLSDLAKKVTLQCLDLGHLDRYQVLLWGGLWCPRLLPYVSRCGPTHSFVAPDSNSAAD